MYYTTMPAAINTIDDIAALAQRISAKVASVLTYDNFTAIAFTASSITRKVLHGAVTAAIVAVYFTAAFAYYLGQVAGEGRYAVRVAAAEIASEDLAPVSLAEPRFVGYVTAPKVTVPALRVRCTLANIVWRDANGLSKHMTKAEMVAALGALS